VSARSLLLVTAIACASCKGASPPVTGTTWPEADALFHSDARWLGADGAYSVELGNDRTLWLFGDTFLASHPGGGTADALFLRNSAAVQTGRDPSHALMAFAWGADDDGAPRSFVPQDGAEWFWPGGGARIGGTLLTFWQRMGTPAGDPSGFETRGWRAVVVDDPDDDASAWTMRDATLPADSHGAAFSGAVLLHDGLLYAYGENAGATHDIVVARWTADAAATGDLSSPAWWCGDAWRADCGGAPAVVVHLGAPEQSVSADGRLAAFVMVQTAGYGATTLAVRTAPAPEGPWSDPVSFFRPPESLDDDAFVYAGKAHPELAGADLVATYVPSTFGSSDDPSLYHPHFVRMTYR
jgi:hypothetical protein